MPRKAASLRTRAEIYLVMFEDYTGIDHFIGICSTRMKGRALLRKWLDPDVSMTNDECDEYIRPYKVL